MNQVRKGLIIFWLLTNLVASAQSRSDDYEKSRQLYYSGHYVSALETINGYLSKKRSVDALYLKFMIHEALQERMNAIEALTAVIVLDPTHMDAVFKRGKLYFDEGIYIKALEDFNTIINFDGERNTAAIYFQVDPNQQEQVKVTSLASMKGQVYGMRGLVHQALGTYDMALSDLGEAIKRDSSAQNHVNRALLFKEMNESEKAKKDLRTAVSLGPDLMLAWFNLLLVEPEVNIPETILSNTGFIPLISYQAVEALQNDDLDLAQSLFSKALSVNPNDPLLLVNAGRLSYKLGNYDDAIKFHQRVLTIEPTRFEVYYLIGNSFFQLKEFSQAAAYYEQFLSRDRSDGMVWYNTALAYRELQDQRRACECLSNARSRGIDIDDGSSLFRECNR